MKKGGLEGKNAAERKGNCCLQWYTLISQISAMKKKKCVQHAIGNNQGKWQ